MFNNKQTTYKTDDEGYLSLYGFINSYRESLEAPYPPLKSQTTIDALNKIKEIMNEISSGNEKIKY